MVAQSQSRLLPYPCERLFSLVLDIERYPEFVPGYLRAQVLRRGTDTLEVEQSVGVGPATVTFRSHAEFAPLQRIAIHAADGPFHGLAMEWSFAPQGSGCRVGFSVGYELRGPLAPLLTRWLERSTPALFDAFMRRATQLDGQKPIGLPPQDYS